MLDLRTLDPARQTADRRVALAFGYGALACWTFAAVGAGAGGWAVATAVVLALGGLPWIFAFGGRWRLLDDALAGVSFWLRGDRVGAWATAPVAVAVLAVGACALIGLQTWLAVLETRFERITDLRAARLRSSPRVNAP